MTTSIGHSSAATGSSTTFQTSDDISYFGICTVKRTTVRVLAKTPKPHGLYGLPSSRQPYLVVHWKTVCLPQSLQMRTSIRSKPLAGEERYTIVGVRKPANDVVNDAPGGRARRAGWKNMDGTSVYSEAWKSGRPNNDAEVSVQAYGVFDSADSKLIDITNYYPPDKFPFVVLNTAVMKCCAKGYIAQTFCSSAP
ncbi:hypothetical protein THAOC_11723 [Thalassiosira oceanica]|uniref:Uncharacterized protein n=1 Tax=Thalassiosira oceanica TaxID=159749 RepID=K0SPN9_THAOC|nr:hypothetical protein THAOC_11723 [Thalassiosira oceanica]|eukprot:EJK67270.1 hypothetical protein THAOC_11723 [Thalassiosira oceanica]